jgi:hypothetical protein
MQAKEVVSVKLPSAVTKETIWKLVDRYDNENRVVKYIPSREKVDRQYLVDVNHLLTKFSKNTLAHRLQIL